MPAQPELKKNTEEEESLGLNNTVNAYTHTTTAAKNCTWEEERVGAAKDRVQVTSDQFPSPTGQRSVQKSRRPWKHPMRRSTWPHSETKHVPPCTDFAGMRQAWKDKVEHKETDVQQKGEDRSCEGLESILKAVVLYRISYPPGPEKQQERCEHATRRITKNYKIKLISAFLETREKRPEARLRTEWVTKKDHQHVTWQEKAATTWRRHGRHCTDMSGPCTRAHLSASSHGDHPCAERDAPVPAHDAVPRSHSCYECSDAETHDCGNNKKNGYKSHHFCRHDSHSVAGLAKASLMASAAFRRTTYLNTCFQDVMLAAIYSRSCIRFVGSATFTARCWGQDPTSPEFRVLPPPAMNQPCLPAYSTTVHNCGGANNKNRRSYLTRASCNMATEFGFLTTACTASSRM